MTYHAIPQIPKSTCTAEQKIAYNIAHNLYGTYSAQYNKRIHNVSGLVKSDFFRHLTTKGIELYKLSYSYKPDKYNLDAIFSALNAGIENYFNASAHILTSYEQIGNMFPALYLAQVAAREF